MRKVVAYELLSLDGVAEKPDGLVADWDDAMNANLGAVIAAQDTVILGRASTTRRPDRPAPRTADPAAPAPRSPLS